MKVEAAMVQEFRFKTGLVRAAEVWSLDGDRLRGPGDAVDLDAVTRASFSTMLGQSVVLTSMALEGDGHSIEASCTDEADGAERATFLELCRAVFERLAVLSPELEVTSPEVRRLSWAVAAIGVAAAVVGVLFALTGVSYGFVFAGLFVVLGVVLVGIASPWRSEPPRNPDATVTWISHLQEL